MLTGTVRESGYAVARPTGLISMVSLRDIEDMELHRKTQLHRARPSRFCYRSRAYCIDISEQNWKNKRGKLHCKEREAIL